MHVHVHIRHRAPSLRSLSSRLIAPAPQAFSSSHSPQRRRDQTKPWVCSDCRASARGPSSPPHALPRRGRRRTYATAPASEGPSEKVTGGDDLERTIAVIGGGITGLASAYYATRLFPKSRVTLFEAKDRLGGWIRSKSVDVGDGEIIVEKGPRSLRMSLPQANLALAMAWELGLVDDIVAMPSYSPAARNRFLYYPDRLVRMPGPGQGIVQNAMTLLTEPVFKNLFKGIFRDAMAAETRREDLQDESVGAFLERRMHRSLSENIVSALLHGIYAGDVWRLSARSIFPLQWEQERKRGSLIGAEWMALTDKTRWEFCDTLELMGTDGMGRWAPEQRQKMQNASTFTFRHGMEQLVKALEQDLLKHPNVTIQRATKIQGVSPEGTGRVKLVWKEPGSSADEPQSSFHSHVISTIPPQNLVAAMPASLRNRPIHAFSSRTLQQAFFATPAVDVLVVNVYYKTPNLLRTINPPGGLPSSLLRTGLQGFGYLIPASVPFTENPERALGVIFDSDMNPDLHTTVPPDRLGTSLTVMLGGHWWDDWTSLPNESEGKALALSVLARHLGITEDPAHIDATLQRDCIPQYTVGHTERMALAHDGLLSIYGGRLRVAGSWYTGVGVHDCLRAAIDVVRHIGAAQGDRGSIRHMERTGLELFKTGRPMALVRYDKSTGGLVVLDLEPLALQLGYFKTVAQGAEETNVGGRDREDGKDD